MDDDLRRAIGLFRFGVLGPLVSARLEHGDRAAYFVEAAARHHVMPPDGRVVRLLLTIAENRRKRCIEGATEKWRRLAGSRSRSSRP